MDYKKYLVLICLSFGLYAGQSFDTLNLTRSGHAVHGWWGHLHDTADVADTCLHSPAAPDSVRTSHKSDTSLDAGKVGGLFTGGSGTQYYVPLWGAGGTVQGNSLLSQDAGGTQVALGQSGAPAARFEICSPSGGASNALRLTQLANNITPAASFLSIDFYVPTTTYVGQFFATANNYATANSYDLAANSMGLWTETTNGQLSLMSGGSGGYVSIGAGGYTPSNEILRAIAGRVTLNKTTNDVAPTLGTESGAFGIFKGTGPTAHAYGLMCGIASSGDAWLQVQSVTAGTAYNLELQPSGGKVQIGSTAADSTLTITGSFRNTGNFLSAGHVQLSNYGAGVAKFDASGSVGSSTNMDSGAVTVGAIPVGVTNTHTLTASNLTESGTTLTVTDSIYASAHGGYFPYGVIVGISAPLTINANSAAHQWTMQTGGATYGYGLNILCTNAANHQILFDTIGGIHAFNLTANDTLYGKDANISDSLYVNSALLTTITAAPYGGYYGGICGSGSTLLTGSSTGGTVIGSGGTGNIYITDAYSTAPALTVRTDSTLFAEPIAGYAGGNLNFAVNGASSINFRYGANLLLSLGYGGTGITFSQLAPASGVSLLTVNTSGLIAAMPHDSIYMGQGIRTAQSFWGTNATLSGYCKAESLATTGGASFGGNVGIGTTAPAQLLHLNSAAATSCPIELSVNGANISYFAVSGATNAFTTGAVLGDLTIRNNYGSIFLTTNTGNNPTVTVTTGNPGNVGRGTPTPVSPLTNIGQFTDTGSIDLTNSIAFDSAQTVTANADQNLTPIRTLIELNGTYNFALQAGSLKNGTVILITRGSGSGGYPNVTYNGHNYAVDANHSFWFVKNSAGTWYPLTPYTS